MTMTLKEYTEVLKAAINGQISYEKEEPNYYESEYLQGVVVGLKIALSKIDAADFLTE